MLLKSINVIKYFNKELYIKIKMDIYLHDKKSNEFYKF